MNKPHMNTATHRLTDGPGERHPHVCQQCGGSNRPMAGNGLLRLELSIWQEHDHNDRPEPRYLVLCNVCSKRMIEPHPRLYSRVETNKPIAGLMDLCVGCRLRDGIGCTSPRAKANGGVGVAVKITPPINAMVDGRNYRGPAQMWPKPAESCDQREAQP
jgi:hypothetical protein